MRTEGFQEMLGRVSSLFGFGSGPGASTTRTSTALSSGVVPSSSVESTAQKELGAAEEAVEKKVTVAEHIAALNAIQSFIDMLDAEKIKNDLPKVINTAKKYLKGGAWEVGISGVWDIKEAGWANKGAISHLKNNWKRMALIKEEPYCLLKLAYKDKKIWEKIIGLTSIGSPKLMGIINALKEEKNTIKEALASAKPAIQKGIISFVGKLPEDSVLNDLEALAEIGFGIINALPSLVQVMSDEKLNDQLFKLVSQYLKIDSSTSKQSRKEFVALFSSVVADKGVTDALVEFTQKVLSSMEPAINKMAGKKQPTVKWKHLVPEIIVPLRAIFQVVQASPTLAQLAGEYLFDAEQATVAYYDTKKTLNLAAARIDNVKTFIKLQSDIKKDLETLLKKTIHIDIPTRTALKSLAKGVRTDQAEILTAEALTNLVKVPKEQFVKKITKLKKLLQEENYKALLDSKDEIIKKLGEDNELAILLEEIEGADADTRQSSHKAWHKLLSERMPEFQAAARAWYDKFPSMVLQCLNLEQTASEKSLEQEIEKLTQQWEDLEPKLISQSEEPVAPVQGSLSGAKLGNIPSLEAEELQKINQLVLKHCNFVTRLQTLVRQLKVDEPKDNLQEIADLFKEMPDSVKVGWNEGITTALNDLQNLYKCSDEEKKNIAQALELDQSAHALPVYLQIATRAEEKFKEAPEIAWQLKMLLEIKAQYAKLKADHELILDSEKAVKAQIKEQNETIQHYASERRDALMLEVRERAVQNPELIGAVKGILTSIFSKQTLKMLNTFALNFGQILIDQTPEVYAPRAKAVITLMTNLFPVLEKNEAALSAVIEKVGLLLRKLAEIQQEFEIGYLNIKSRARGDNKTEQDEPYKEQWDMLNKKREAANNLAYQKAALDLLGKDEVREGLLEIILTAGDSKTLIINALRTLFLRIPHVKASVKERKEHEIKKAILDLMEVLGPKIQGEKEWLDAVIKALVEMQNTELSADIAYNTAIAKLDLIKDKDQISKAQEIRDNAKSKAYINMTKGLLSGKQVGDATMCQKTIEILQKSLTKIGKGKNILEALKALLIATQQIDENASRIQLLFNALEVITPQLEDENKRQWLEQVVKAFMIMNDQLEEAEAQYNEALRNAKLDKDVDPRTLESADFKIYKQIKATKARKEAYAYKKMLQAVLIGEGQKHAVELLKPLITPLNIKVPEGWLELAASKLVSMCKALNKSEDWYQKELEKLPENESEYTPHQKLQLLRLKAKNADDTLIAYTDILNGLLSDPNMRSHTISILQSSAESGVANIESLRGLILSSEAQNESDIQREKALSLIEKLAPHLKDKEGWLNHVCTSFVNMNITLQDAAREYQSSVEQLFDLNIELNEEQLELQLKDLAEVRKKSEQAAYTNMVTALLSKNCQDTLSLLQILTKEENNSSYLEILESLWISPIKNNEDEETKQYKQMMSSWFKLLRGLAPHLEKIDAWWLEQTAKAWHAMNEELRRINQEYEKNKASLKLPEGALTEEDERKLDKINVAASKAKSRAYNNIIFTLLSDQKPSQDADALTSRQHTIKMLQMLSADEELVRICKECFIPKGLEHEPEHQHMSSYLDLLLSLKDDLQGPVNEAWLNHVCKAYVEMQQAIRAAEEEFERQSLPPPQDAKKLKDDKNSAHRKAYNTMLRKLCSTETMLPGETSMLDYTLAVLQRSSDNKLRKALRDILVSPEPSQEAASDTASTKAHRLYMDGIMGLLDNLQPHLIDVTATQWFHDVIASWIEVQSAIDKEVQPAIRKMLETLFSQQKLIGGQTFCSYTTNLLQAQLITSAGKESILQPLRQILVSLELPNESEEDKKWRQKMDASFSLLEHMLAKGDLKQALAWLEKCMPALLEGWKQLDEANATYSATQERKEGQTDEAHDEAKKHAEKAKIRQSKEAVSKILEAVFPNDDNEIKDQTLSAITETLSDPEVSKLLAKIVDLEASEVAQEPSEKPEQPQEDIKWNTTEHELVPAVVTLLRILQPSLVEGDCKDCLSNVLKDGMVFYNSFMDAQLLPNGEAAAKARDEAIIKFAQAMLPASTEPNDEKRLQYVVKLTQQVLASPQAMQDIDSILLGPDNATLRGLFKLMPMLIDSAPEAATWLQALLPAGMPHLSHILAAQRAKLLADAALEQKCNKLRQSAEQAIALKNTSSSDEYLTQVADSARALIVALDDFKGSKISSKKLDRAKAQYSQALEKLSNTKLKEGFAKLKDSINTPSFENLQKTCDAAQEQRTSDIAVALHNILNKALSQEGVTPGQSMQKYTIERLTILIEGGKKDSALTNLLLGSEPASGGEDIKAKLLDLTGKLLTKLKNKDVQRHYLNTLTAGIQGFCEGYGKYSKGEKDKDYTRGKVVGAFMAIQAIMQDTDRRKIAAEILTMSSGLIAASLEGTSIAKTLQQSYGIDSHQRVKMIDIITTRLIVDMRKPKNSVLERLISKITPEKVATLYDRMAAIQRAEGRMQTLWAYLKAITTVLFTGPIRRVVFHLIIALLRDAIYMSIPTPIYSLMIGDQLNSTLFYHRSCCGGMANFTQVVQEGLNGKHQGVSGSVARYAYTNLEFRGLSIRMSMRYYNIIDTNWEGTEFVGKRYSAYGNSRVSFECSHIFNCNFANVSFVAKEVSLNGAMIDVSSLKSMMPSLLAHGQVSGCIGVIARNKAELLEAGKLLDKLYKINDMMRLYPDSWGAVLIADKTNKEQYEAANLLLTEAEKEINTSGSRLGNVAFCSEQELRDLGDITFKDRMDKTVADRLASRGEPRSKG